MKKISLLARRTVGETNMSDALKTSTYAPLRSIAGKIDGIGAGSDREDHKYQHPLMVTMKRLMNSLSCVIPLLMPASILNSLPKNENASMIIAMAYVIGVNTSVRAMERNSLALLFQHIKGCSEAARHVHGLHEGECHKDKTKAGKQHNH